MRAEQKIAGTVDYESCFILHFSAAIGPDLVRPAGEGAPELLAHQADERRALVEAVVAGDDLEHLQVARRRRKRADLDLGFRHIQILYKTCIAGQPCLPAAAAASAAAPARRAASAAAVAAEAAAAAIGGKPRAAPRRRRRGTDRVPH